MQRWWLPRCGEGDDSICGLFLPAQVQKCDDLVNLFITHFAGNGMVGPVYADQCGCMIVINLRLREIGNAVFSFCEYTVATGAMFFEQHLAFICFFNQQFPVHICNV